MTLADDLLALQVLDLALPALHQRCKEEMRLVLSRAALSLSSAEGLLKANIQPGAQMHLNYALNQLLRAQQFQQLLPELQPTAQERDDG